MGNQNNNITYPQIDDLLNTCMKILHEQDPELFHMTMNTKMEKYTNKK